MTQSENKTNTYLSFYLGSELFGANVQHILEVLRNEPLTDIPKSKDFIKGIINFRGEIVTVIDLFSKLNMPGDSEIEKPITIVFEIESNHKSVKVGVLVNRVKKVFEMPDSEQLPIPEFGKYYNPEYLTGVAKTKEGFVLLLNIAKVLNDEEVKILIDTNSKNI